MCNTSGNQGQEQFSAADYGCAPLYYTMLDNLWPHLLQILRKDLNNENLTLVQAQQHIINNKQTSTNTKNLNTLDGTPLVVNRVTNPYFNRIIQKAILAKNEETKVNVPTLVLPQDEKVIYLPQVKAEPVAPVTLTPSLETKQDKCAYYQENPDKYLYYIKESDKREMPLFTFLHLVPIFRVVSKAERKTLTLPEDIDKQRDKPEVVKSSDGKYELTGPVLCTQDLLVFYALMYIYALEKTEGLSVLTDYSQLYKALNPKSKYNIGSDNAKVLKRSLIRLSFCNIKKSDSGKHLKGFDGSLINIDDTTAGRYKKLQIQFNKNFINHLIYNSFIKVDLDILLDLNAYELKLYSYLLVRGFKSGIDYKISTVFDCLYSKQNEVSQNDKLTKIGKAINSLIKKGLLQPQSGLVKSASFKKESHYLLNLV